MSSFGLRTLGRSRRERGPAAARSRERSELEALHETALALIERIDLESVLQAIMSRAGNLVGTEHGYLYLMEPGGGELLARVGTGIYHDLPGFRLEVGSGLAGRVAATGEPLVVDDYTTWDGAKPELRRYQQHAVVGVPLSRGGQVVGVLGVSRAERDGGFDGSEVALLVRFGHLAALALENSRLYAAAQDELAQRRAAEDELLDTIALLQRTEEAHRLAQTETIRRLGYVADYRHAETGEHIERVSRLCGLLGHRLGLDEVTCRLLQDASPLHDIGKVVIPDEILHKPGPLTVDERREIRRHTAIGHELLTGSASELLELAATIALTHHEWYDGSGYPQGLAGEAIPLAGRITAVADVYDALTSDRSYRSALTEAQALDAMRRQRGTQFDPLVLDALFDVVAELDTERAEHGRPVDRSRAPVRAPARDEPEAPRLTGLDPEALRHACASAFAVLEHGDATRRTVEDCCAAFVARLEAHVLVSVYVREHDRLWLVAQSGYSEVLDGFTLDRGVMARAVRTGTPQYVEDVTQDREFLEAMSGIVSELTIPFNLDGPGPQGALNVETIGATLPAESEQLLTPLAELLGELLTEMREGLDVDVATLARLCVHASSIRGTVPIAEFAARTVGRLLDLDCVQVDLHQDESAYSLASFWRRSPGLTPLASQAAQRLAHDEDDKGFAPAYHLLDLRETGLVAKDAHAPWAVRFPLRVAGGSIGAITGRSAGRPDHDMEGVEAATLFVQHAAALLDVSLALRRQQRAAVTDSLTGLLNRRGFDERLDEELERARRSRSSVALVVADWDDLKRVNDRGGHELGDRMLQSFAGLLRGAKRAGDTAARVGGDEFALILPGATTQAGLRVAERLRRGLVGRPVGDEPHVVATFGVATYPADGRTASELMRAADRALYLAKRAGKNRALALPADAA